MKSLSLLSVFNSFVEKKITSVLISLLLSEVFIIPVLQRFLRNISLAGMVID